jgi:hypothetical protein
MWPALLPSHTPTLASESDTRHARLVIPMAAKDCVTFQSYSRPTRLCLSTAMPSLGRVHRALADVCQLGVRERVALLQKGTELCAGWI